MLGKHLCRPGQDLAPRLSVEELENLNWSQRSRVFLLQKASITNKEQFIPLYPYLFIQIVFQPHLQG